MPEGNSCQPRLHIVITRDVVVVGGQEGSLGGDRDTGPGVPLSEGLINCFGVWPMLSAVITAPKVIIRYSHG